MMGVPISGTSYIYWYSLLAIYNTQHYEYTMRKKSNSIFYHAMKESVAMGASLTPNIPTNDNTSDLMIKVLVGEKRKKHVGNILYYIYDEHC